eukprot:TRINITY_DN8214_c1_g2_i2.p1 TRINITY_DN8214_c1_g2~~TRINITY_DN8214_c1_g2_i2.p1  ORF type:complete len:748 (+),score=161.74 TRINITY_DN8214_c1_g2_i2:37-2280(+)
MPGKKRRWAEVEKEKGGFAELKPALEAVRAAVGDIDEFVQVMTKKAGHLMQLDKQGLGDCLDEACPGHSVTDEQVDTIVYQAKKAKKGKVTEAAPLAEVIWLVRHHGVEKTAESRLAARSGLQKRSAGSDAFEKFYKAQKVVPEGEWDDFMESFKTPLPMTLRFTTTRPYSYIIQEEARKLINDPSTQLKDIPWAGEGEIAAVTCSHSAFHDKTSQTMPEWCKEQNVLGTGFFQEAASLLPPLLLNLSHEHIMLDMCSAPGSKLLQCVDIMAAKAAQAGELITGGIMSNEIDKKKAVQIIPARLKRAHTHNVVVTASDARLFPKLYDRPTGETPTKRLYFDRILADVPCSGDGTGRKDQNIWETWSTHYCLSLHVKQLQILMKGLDSLADGGRLVYSTCSLNPLEDEAVVMAALRTMKDQVRLLPVKLDGFKFQAGVTTWGVPDEEGNLHEKTDLPNDKMGEKGWAKSMFPVADELQGEAVKCGRVLPHHNDTSGFFLAVFERFHVPEEEIPTAPRKARAEAGEGDGEKPKNKGNTGLGGMRNARMYYHLVSELDAAWQQTSAWFGLGEKPEEKLRGQTLLVQLSEHDKACKKGIFLTTPGTERLLHSLLPVSQTNNVAVTTVGARILTLLKGNYLKDIACKYRPAFEGASFLSTMATDARKILLPPEVIMPLLKEKFLPMSEELTKYLPSELYKGPCLVGIAPLPEGHSQWSKVWLTCILLPTKLELTVEDHEREGLLSLMKRVFK